ncbi:glycosyltransferase [candidate division KSB1 bacterium]|nr:glycosyltransferase [candidate division KSB1 bacterium]
MTVLHVLHSSLPLLSGYSIRTQHVLKHQQRYCTPIGVTSPYQVATCEVETIEGVTYYHAPRSARTAFLERHNVPVAKPHSLQKDFEHALARLIHDVQPDIVHGHSSHSVSWPAYRAAQRLHLPFVYEMRGLWEESAVAKGFYGRGSLRYRYHRHAELALAHRAAKVFVISQTLREELIARGVPESKIVVVPNGVEVHELESTRNTSLREQYGLEHAVVLGYIGSLNGYESLELFLSAFAQLVQKGKRVKGMIVGDGPEKENLIEHARRLGLREHVIFTGQIAPQEIHDYHALLDVFVLARSHSRVAQLVTPLKPYEAMAAGICLLVSRLPALQEIVQEEVTGLCFRSGEAHDLARQCERLIDDHDLRQRLGGAAREWVLQNRQWRELVKIYLEHYNMILSLRSTKPNEIMQKESFLALEWKPIGDLSRALATFASE